MKGLQNLRDFYYKAECSAYRRIKNVYAFPRLVLKNQKTRPLHSFELVNCSLTGNTLQYLSSVPIQRLSVRVESENELSTYVPVNLVAMLRIFKNTWRIRNNLKYLTLDFHKPNELGLYNEIHMYENQKQIEESKEINLLKSLICLNSLQYLCI